MSQTAHSLSLNGRDDEAFESQVRAAARLRLLRAHARHSRARHASSPRFLSHAHRWRRAACLAAGAAFGAGMLWPVNSQQPESSLAAPERAIRGGQFAVLDSTAQAAH